MQKHKLTFFILLFAVIIGGGVYKYLYFTSSSNSNEKEDSSISSLSQTESISSVAEKTNSSRSLSPSEIQEIKQVQVVHTVKKAEEEEEEEGLNEYSNALRKFSLKYRDDLSFKEYDEGNDTYSVVFEDKAGAKSFQIFFTPYFGNVITQSRILKDVPSGKFTKPIEIVIGEGIPALAFTSESDLGQMREVWFLYNDYLYEVTTYADMDTWLAEIMKTWSFDF